MKIKFDFDSIQLNTNDLLRKCGYRSIRSRKGDLSYVRTLRSGNYPRFHIYVHDYGFNLHLDQKAPSYSGSHAHNASYQGDLVEKESKRIKQILNSYKK